MKKFAIIFALAGVVATSTHAQKFEGGENNLEVQFQSPFAVGAPFNLLNGIRYRKFTSGSSALRIHVNIDYSTNSNVTQQEDSENDMEELRSRSSDFMIDVRPGYELHFGGSDRLSPYVGGEVQIAYRRTAYNEEFQDADDNVYYVRTINGLHSGASGAGITNNPGTGYMEFGLNGVFGADFYFVDNVYLGAEMSFGLAYRTNNKVKLKGDHDDFEEPDPETQGNSFSLEPDVVGSFRLGYLF